MYLHQFMNVFRCRKSVKSLFFLLPLLGITNVLHFVWPNPLRGSWLSFAVWSITSHFLYSFQGVFVASVYFLFDDKVRKSQTPKNRCNWLISNFSFFALCFWPFKPLLDCIIRDIDFSFFFYRWRTLCTNSGFWKFVCETGAFPIVSTILRDPEAFVQPTAEFLNHQIWILKEVSIKLLHLPFEKSNFYSSSDGKFTCQHFKLWHPFHPKQFQKDTRLHPKFT